MVTSITTALGFGAGLDTAKLVADLAAAAKQPKEAQIVKREELNTAKVSALGKVTSGIDAFASALSSLISGGTLFTQPTSSDSGLATVSSPAGTRLGTLSAQLEVKRLATAQSLSSGAAITDPAAAIGQGTIKLTTSTGTFDVVIGAGEDSLTGLAKAINGANANVTASVVKDGANYRLVVKGATGAPESFTMALDSGDPDALGRFTWDGSAGTMNRTQTAQNAQVVLDGLTLERESNTIKDLIPGVTIALQSATPGKTITIGSQRPTETIRAAVSDFVAAYNEIKATIDEAAKVGTPGGDDAGPLRGNVAVRELQRQLAKLTSTNLAGAGDLKTLADIGVRTDRNGMLSVNEARLGEVLAANPDGVEALFNPTQGASSELVSITSAMGKTKPGSYALTDLVLGPPASGKIAGVDALVVGDTLIASMNSPAAGLVIKLNGDLVAGTVTVDAGLGGALQMIRDSLRASGGAFASASTQLSSEKETIAKDRTKMEARADVYEAQLSRSFGSMDARVAAINATKSYIEQQIKVWTNSND